MNKKLAVYGGILVVVVSVIFLFLKSASDDMDVQLHRANGLDRDASSVSDKRIEQLSEDIDKIEHPKTQKRKQTEVVRDRAENEASEHAFSLEDFKKIQTGMTYAQVVEILGKEGVETSRNLIEAVPGVMAAVETVMYNWSNGDSSNVMAMFQNNKLNTKSQFGLK